MSPNTSDKTSSQWWRWLLLPIAASVGGIAGSALFGLVQWIGMKFQGFSEDGWMFLYILPALISGTFGWLYVYISCAVAPRGKVIAGTVMTTLLVVTGLTNLFDVWGLQLYGTGDTVRLTICSIVASAAGIAALVQAHSEHSW